MKKIKGISKFFYAVFITIDVILLVAAAVILITTLVFGGGGSDTSVFGHNIILVDTDEFPLFKKGSAVITEEISAGELKEKNIVIFKNENGAPAIGEILSAQEEITALSRGETITLSADRIIGKAVYYSEILGGIISFAVSPAGVCTIAILPCLAFVLFQLAAASRAKNAEEDKEDYRGFGSERKKSAEKDDSKDDNAPVKKRKKDEISQKHASTGTKKAEEEKEDYRGSELKKSAEMDGIKDGNAPVKKSKKDEFSQKHAPKEEDNGGEKITDYKIKTAEFKAAGTAEEKAEEKAAAAKAAEEARLEAERRAAERAERIAAEKAKAERLAAEKAEAERIAAEKAEAERREREKTSAVEKQKLYEAAGLFNPMMKKRSGETAVIKKADKEEKTAPVLVSEAKKTEAPEIKEEVRTYEPKKEEKDAKTGEERLDSLFTEEDDSDNDYDIDEILRSIEEKRKNK